MTLPDERYRAVRETRRFLQSLVSAAATPGIPKIIRNQALGMLRHYPSDWDLDQLAAAAPEVLAQRLDLVTEFVVSKSRAEEQNKPK
jgi:hypothetical protein